MRCWSLGGKLEDLDGFYFGELQKAGKVEDEIDKAVSKRYYRLPLTLNKSPLEVRQRSPGPKLFAIVASFRSKRTINRPSGMLTRRGA